MAGDWEAGADRGMGPGLGECGSIAQEAIARAYLAWAQEKEAGN